MTSSDAIRASHAEDRAGSPHAEVTLELRESMARRRYGVLAVATGVLGLVVAFVLTLYLWKDTSGLVALAAISSPIVAIVTAYFGIQASSKATEEAQRTSRRLLERMPPFADELRLPGRSAELE